jgi:DNA-binding IclR family transcriptional regulator
VAAIVVVIPSNRVTPQKEAAAIAHLKKTASIISAQLKKTPVNSLSLNIKQ